MFNSLFGWSKLLFCHWDKYLLSSYYISVYFCLPANFHHIWVIFYGLIHFVCLYLKIFYSLQYHVVLLIEMVVISAVPLICCLLLILDHFLSCLVICGFKLLFLYRLSWEHISLGRKCVEIFKVAEKGPLPWGHWYVNSKVHNLTNHKDIQIKTKQLKMK